jgi:hypothetical protein
MDNLPLIEAKVDELVELLKKTPPNRRTQHIPNKRQDKRSVG